MEKTAVDFPFWLLVLPDIIGYSESTEQRGPGERVSYSFLPKEPSRPFSGSSSSLNLFHPRPSSGLSVTFTEESRDLQVGSPSILHP